MLILILVGNEDVVHIYDHKHIQEWPQDFNHHPHEICWIISQNERHGQQLKKTFGIEGSLLDIGLLNLVMVVFEL